MNHEYNIEIRQETNSVDDEQRLSKVFKKSKMYTCLLNEAFMSQQCFHRELKQVSKLDKRLLVLKEENVNLKAVDDVTFLVKNVCVIELPKLWFDQTSMMDFVVQKCDAILKTVIFCLIYCYN